VFQKGWNSLPFQLSETIKTPMKIGLFHVPPPTWNKLEQSPLFHVPPTSPLYRGECGTEGRNTTKPFGYDPDWNRLFHRYELDP
jgi:hypothetical protein